MVPTTAHLAQHFGYIMALSASCITPVRVLVGSAGSCLAERLAT